MTMRGDLCCAAKTRFFEVDGQAEYHGVVVRLSIPRPSNDGVPNEPSGEDEEGDAPQKYLTRSVVIHVTGESVAGV